MSDFEVKLLEAKVEALEKVLRAIRDFLRSTQSMNYLAQLDLADEIDKALEDK